MDVFKEIEGIAFVASITDQTLQTIDSAPWARDLLLSAEKKVSGALPPWQGPEIRLTSTMPPGPATVPFKLPSACAALKRCCTTGIKKVVVSCCALRGQAMCMPRLASTLALSQRLPGRLLTLTSRTRPLLRLRPGSSAVSCIWQRRHLRFCPVSRLPVLCHISRSWWCQHISRLCKQETDRCQKVGLELAEVCSERLV